MDDAGRFHDPYIAWVQAQPPAAFDHDLGSSGLGLAWDWKAWGVDLNEAPADGPNWFGLDELRARLAGSMGVDMARVLVTPGCTGANALVLAALVSPGTRVAVESPVYSPPVNVARGLGAEVVTVPRHESLAWALDLETLERDLRGAALFFLTNPHNPTGRLLDEGAISEVAGACARAGAVLVVDEVYREFPEAAHVRSAVHAGPNVVITSSVTKAYGLGGLRVGWIAGPRRLVERCVAANRTILGRGSVPGEWLVAKLLANALKWRALRDQIAARVEAGRTLAHTFVTERPGLSWVRPEAGITGLVRLPEGVTGHALAERARTRGRVYLVPGEFFGAPGMFRLSFGAGEAAVRAGLERLGEVLDRP